jgi:NADH-quinone oxidoreductase subunit L
MVNLRDASAPEWLFQIISGLISIGGIWMAYRIFYKRTAFTDFLNKSRISDFFYQGWGFDKLYDKIFVRPVVWLSEIDKNDFIDKIYNYLARVTSYSSSVLSRTQNGRLRWYVMVLTAGIVVLLTIMMVL